MVPPNDEPRTQETPESSGGAWLDQGQIGLDFEPKIRPPRDMLGDCLEAVLVTGLEQIRRDLLLRAEQEELSHREELLSCAQGLATDAPDRIRRALALWTQATSRLLQSKEIRQGSVARSGVEGLVDQLPRDLPFSVRILGDELARVLGERSIRLPALAEGADSSWSLSPPSLADVTTLGLEALQRMTPPTLPGSYPEGIAEPVYQVCGP